MVERDLGSVHGKGKGKRALLYVGVDGPVYDSPPPEDPGVVASDEGDVLPRYEPGLSPIPTTGVDGSVLKPFRPRAQSQSQSQWCVSPPTLTATATAAQFKPEPHSPIYISSRSPSPISSLTSSSEEDQAALWNSDDSDLIILPAKRKKKRKTKQERKTKVPDGGEQSEGKVKSEVRLPTVVQAGRTSSKRIIADIGLKLWKVKHGAVSSAVSSGVGTRASSRLSAGSGLVIDPTPSPVIDSPSAPNILSKLKSNKASMPNGQSAAVTRVKRKKVEVPSVKEPQSNSNSKPVVSGAVAVNPAQSIAVTRVRKRKVSERGMMMEPPLKRARQHSGNGGGRDSAGGGSSMGTVVVSGSTSNVKAKGQEPSPKKRGRPAKAKGMKWPVKMKVGEGLQKVGLFLPRSCNA